MIDFLIMYECKNRELFGDILLGEELKHRGFSVEYVHSHYYRGKKKKAKVMIVPYGYDNQTIYHHIYRVCGKQQIVLNLRSEQIVAKKFENDYTSWCYPKDEAKKMFTVSWGRMETEGLRNVGLPCDKIIEAGNINFDPLLIHCDFIGKEELGKRYSIDAKNKWALFISSFSLVGLTPEEEIGMKKKVGEEGLCFYQLSIDSRKIILDWFKRILNKEDGVEIIYRRHPVEGKDSELAEIEKKYQHFHVVYDETVSEWINASDKVYNWYSTSSVQTIMLNKQNVLLRPVDFPVSEDVSIFDHDLKIRTYREFEEDFVGAVTESSGHNIDRYLQYFSLKKGAFVRVADFCVSLIDGIDKGQKCDIDYEKVKSSVSIKYRILYIILYNMIYPFYGFSLKHGIRLSSTVFPGYGEFLKVMNNRASETEMIALIKKADGLIDEYKIKG